MESLRAKVDILATYVAEQGVGDIYEHDEWTLELKAVVAQYLIHETTDDDYKALLGELTYMVPVDSRTKQVAFILAQHEPSEVAAAYLMVEVNKVPTLDQLIGQWDAWPSDDERSVALDWLFIHDSDDLFREVAHASGHKKLLSERHGHLFPEDLAETFTPPELLAAWHKVVGPAPSDLTDAEWALLVPILPSRGKFSPLAEDERLSSMRQRFDGWLYRHDTKCSWREIPPRYGNRNTLQLNHSYSRHNGFFKRLLEALENNPEAARITTWLRDALDSGNQRPVP